MAAHAAPSVPCGIDLPDAWMSCIEAPVLVGLRDFCQECGRLKSVLTPEQDVHMVEPGEVGNRRPRFPPHKFSVGMGLPFKSHLIRMPDGVWRPVWVVENVACGPNQEGDDERAIAFLKVPGP